MILNHATSESLFTEDFSEAVKFITVIRRKFFVINICFDENISPENFPCLLSQTIIIMFKMAIKALHYPVENRTTKATKLSVVKSEA